MSHGRTRAARRHCTCGSSTASAGTSVALMAAAALPCMTACDALRSSPRQAGLYVCSALPTFVLCAVFSWMDKRRAALLAPRLCVPASLYAPPSAPLPGSYSLPRPVHTDRFGARRPVRFRRHKIQKEAPALTDTERGDAWRVAVVRAALRRRCRCWHRCHFELQLVPASGGTATHSHESD